MPIVPRPRRHTADDLAPAFAALRRRIGVELDPPDAARATARARVTAGPRIDGHADRTGVELWSIDPEGSRDLDQAMHLERAGSGYVVHYAIADVGAWVDPDDAIDRSARDRGTTVYCPDRRAPLHPVELSERAASLLADGGERPAVLWRLALDQRGTLTGVHVERALVRNRRARDYGEVQRELDGGTADEQVRLLVEVGTLRRTLEVARGGISLQLPEQTVTRVGHHYELTYESTMAVEEHNAQISLCTGMAAATLMIEAGVGVLRTLPPADPEVVEHLRRQAAALGFDWPAEQPYPAFLRGVDGTTATGAALMTQAARTLRGAGYLAFDGDLPAEHGHAAVAGPYAHVTAPLRRLCDRATNECVLAAAAGTRPAAWALAAIAELPAEMDAANQRAGAVERGVVDICEAALLAHRVGDHFEGHVLSANATGLTVQILDPAVIAAVPTPHGTTAGRRPDLGATVTLRLADADPAEGNVAFTLV